MRKVLLLSLLLLPQLAWAHEYPAAEVVQFVLECMENHAGKYEYLYKCSCVMDTFQKKLKFDDYVELSTSSRGQSTRGEAGGVFRDPPEVKKKAKRYDEMKAAAEKGCLF
ncbi:MAG: hypothetical protein ACREUV_08425 [Burkholderiales bacterium]